MEITTNDEGDAVADASLDWYTHDTLVFRDSLLFCARAGQLMAGGGVTQIRVGERPVSPLFKVFYKCSYLPPDEAATMVR
jgi:hypothetical protein